MLLSSVGTSIANVGLPTMTQVFNASFLGTRVNRPPLFLAGTTLIVSGGRLGTSLAREPLLLTEEIAVGMGEWWAVLED